MLDKEKKMIKDGLKNLKERGNFEELLNSPPTMYHILISHPKSNAMAEELRIKGNNFFNQSNHDVCVHYDVISSYNKSVGLAPPNSESLALAHGNRSAIFEHIGKYEESIFAIDKAIRITKSLPLRVKLLCRKSKRAAALGSSDAIEYLAQARSWFNKLDKAEKMKTTLGDIINKTETLIEKKSQNSSRSDAKILEIQAALAIIYYHLQSCDPVKESPLLNQLGMRIFITALKQSGGVLNLRAALESYEISQDWAKSVPEADYRRIYALSSNMKMVDLDALVLDSALNLVILAKHTSIFKKVFDPHSFTLDRLMSNDDILYMGAVLLKFCANFRAFDCKREKPCSFIGCGLLSWSLGIKTSLAYRNCVPNTIRFMIESNKIALYSIRPIKRGAMIIDSRTSLKYSYLNIFNNVSKVERQVDFQERFGFSCECQACHEDWPAISYENDFGEFYAKEAPFLSEKRLKMLDEFCTLSKTNSDLTLAERISRFSRLIQQSLEESPLPSKLTAFIIRGFIALMHMTCGFPYEFQIANECDRHQAHKQNKHQQSGQSCNGCCSIPIVILSKFTSLFYDIFDPDDSDFTLEEFMSNDEILYTGALILKFCAIADSHGFENQRLSGCKQLKPCEEIACGSTSWSLGLKTSLTSPS
ncbi:hypothetical protein QAD02_011598 [Eretmocerus hayati]|uniref:Uncharacterized protein n=1 Tax=Eretmocerus hayati TaxID=131215 RepID=A0ACC2NXG7_9HYME|nr:hypothetical protein QAD02_011598 [Eretmocerus hayati]